MRLVVDTSRVQFTVSKSTEAKKDQDGKQRADRRTGELLYTVQLVAFDETGAEVITVTMAGQPSLLSSWRPSRGRRTAVTVRRSGRRRSTRSRPATRPPEF